MAVDLACRACGTDDYVVLLEKLTGTQRRLKCENCGAEWLRGEPISPKAPAPSLDDIRRRFPTPERVGAEAAHRATELKAEFLAVQPKPEANVAAFWAKYQQVFSADGLPNADPQDLKDFANSNVGANPGNMSVFNDEWNSVGAEAAAAQVRRAIEYLLRGTSPADIEDRLTALINDRTPYGFKGFKEALLTKVLCIVYPDRFLPIVKYTGEAGKREIARAIWGLELPDPESTTWTIGRLILWSNDLLVELLGDGFAHQQHAAAFLWWAKDRA